MTIELAFLRLNLERARQHLIDELEMLKGYSSSVSEKLESIKNEKRGILSDIEHTLKKVDDGTYGICDRCGKHIETGRLEILPYTPTCRRCELKKPCIQSINDN